MGFNQFRVEGCLYIYRKKYDWINIINYVDVALKKFLLKDSPLPSSFLQTKKTVLKQKQKLKRKGSDLETGTICQL